MSHCGGCRTPSSVSLVSTSTVISTHQMLRVLQHGLVGSEPITLIVYLIKLWCSIIYGKYNAMHRSSIKGWTYSDWLNTPVYWLKLQHYLQCNWSCTKTAWYCYECTARVTMSMATNELYLFGIAWYYVDNDSIIQTFDSNMAFSKLHAAASLPNWLELDVIWCIVTSLVSSLTKFYRVVLCLI